MSKLKLFPPYSSKLYNKKQRIPYNDVSILQS